MLPPLFISIFISLLHLSGVWGHGRLVEPPSRSSMWRFGFKTKPNYNDNELFCGGYTVQFQRNGGKCGVCGDAWDSPSPRPNEAGGIYGQGIITREYKPGQIIKSTVELTANHRGFFEFKLCPHNSPTTVVSQGCLDNYPLELADGSGTKYFPSPGTGPFSVQLRLPNHLTCSQCVFQWTYTAGNNWGRCENGSSKVGCGPQETFRGCSDVSVGNVDTNDIPTYVERPLNKPSISAMPTRRSTVRPRYRPRPTASTGKPITYHRRPPYNNNNRKPYRPTSYEGAPTRRPISNEIPVQRPKPTPSYRPPARPTRYRRPPKPTSYHRVPTRRPAKPTSYPKAPSKRPSRRPSTYKPIYTPRPTPYRPIPGNRKTHGIRKQTLKNKDSTKKTTNIELESKGCKAVGVWASISGIAGWCDTNCARGYCPSSHCDCS